MTGYSAVEKLYNEGYDIVELSVVYYDAICNKRMREDKITEEYLKENVVKASDMKVKVKRKELEACYEKQYDFISREYGIVFIIDFESYNIVQAVNEYGAIHHIKFDTLIPLKVKRQLYKDMFDSPIAKYVSIDHTMSRKEIYRRLRVRGTSRASLELAYVKLNPHFSNQETTPKYISKTGEFSQTQVNYLVEKFNEDLTVLEVLDIVLNPAYVEQQDEKTKTYSKKIDKKQQ